MLCVQQNTEFVSVRPRRVGDPQIHPERGTADPADCLQALLLQGLFYFQGNPAGAMVIAAQPGTCRGEPEAPDVS